MPRLIEKPVRVAAVGKPPKHIDEVVGRLIKDLRSNGRTIAEPSDPLNDGDFIRALIETYTIAPTTEWLEIPAA